MKQSGWLETRVESKHGFYVKMPFKREVERNDAELLKRSQSLDRARTEFGTECKGSSPKKDVATSLITAHFQKCFLCFNVCSTIKCTVYMQYVVTL